MTAAAENIYDSLLNDEFFIDLINGFEKVLTGLGGLVDGFGGLGGVLATVGSVFLSYYILKSEEQNQLLTPHLKLITYLITVPFLIFSSRDAVFAGANMASARSAVAAFS